MLACRLQRRPKRELRVLATSLRELGTRRASSDRPDQALSLVASRAGWVIGVADIRNGMIAPLGSR
jgi:hypothetical protein